RADDDDEYANVYFYLADILCAISSICVCSKLICPRDVVEQCELAYKDNSL
ncbi:18224_t:CDS:2, partial [Rhizophagus irregularis]